MKEYKITKYNPCFRSDKGAYALKNEWTSISDIGKASTNYLTFEEYFQTETAYVKAIQILMQVHNVEELIVFKLEHTYSTKDLEVYLKKGYLQGIDGDFDKHNQTLRDGDRMQGKALERMIRLILRELVWMEMVAEGLKIRFGYDYYMYAVCPPLDEEIIKRIESKGVFVE